MVKNLESKTKITKKEFEKALKDGKINLKIIKKYQFQ
jgi:hypothetical protein